MDLQQHMSLRTTKIPDSTNSPEQIFVPIPIIAPTPANSYSELLYLPEPSPHVCKTTKNRWKILQVCSQFLASGSRSCEEKIKIHSSISPPASSSNSKWFVTSNEMMCKRSGTQGGDERGSLNPNHSIVHLNSLESFPCYAGEMDRDTATRMLMDSANQENGIFLLRVRPKKSQQTNNDAVYALSLRWNEQVIHIRILVTRDEKSLYLSDSRYFKSVVDLIHWYQNNTLSESFPGLFARLKRPFVRLGVNNEQGVFHRRAGPPVPHPRLRSNPAPLPPPKPRRQQPVLSNST